MPSKTSEEQITKGVPGNRMPSHFLLVTWEGGGTIPPEIGIARRLIDAGHQVTVLSDPTVADATKGMGAAFVPWDSAPHRNTFDAEEDFVRDWEQGNPLAMLKNLRDRLLIDPARDYAADTRTVIERVKPDVVLVDYLLLGPIAAAQSAGLPVGVLIPNIWPLPAKGAPAFGPGFIPAHNIVGRTRDAVLHRMTKRIFDGRLDDFNEVRSELDLPPLNDLWDQVRSADRILVLTSPTFDFASPFAPHNAVFTGPILDEPEWTEPLELPWKSSDTRPLVLVSLTSTYQAQEDLIRRIISAVENRDLRTVITVGPMLDPAMFTSPSQDVVITQSAPHGPILGQATAVITHCGHGTTMKALTHGLPLLCIPMGRDQDDTAARVAYAGAGIRLKPGSSSAEIGRNLDRLLETPTFADAARSLARAIKLEHAKLDITAVCEALLNIPAT